MLSRRDSQHDRSHLVNVPHGNQRQPRSATRRKSQGCTASSGFPPKT
jgi:hypothetical protein